MTANLSAGKRGGKRARSKPGPKIRSLEPKDKTSTRQPVLRRARAKRRPKGNYEIGYARPPKHTQFPKGRSPNPGGRRKESSESEFKDILERILNEKVVNVDDRKHRRLSKFELSLVNLVDRASRGERLAWRELITTMERCGIDLSTGETKGLTLTFIIEDEETDDEDEQEELQRQQTRAGYGDLLLRILKRTVAVIVAGKRRRVSKFELGLRNLADAAREDRLALRELLRTMERFGIKLGQEKGELIFIDRTKRHEHQPKTGPA
jgi:hypothetical protein